MPIPASPEAVAQSALKTLKTCLNGQVNCALLDFPDYANVGDSAIWLGQVVAAIYVTIVFPENWSNLSPQFQAAGRAAPAITLAMDVFVTAWTAFFLLQAGKAYPEHEAFESPVTA